MEFLELFWKLDTDNGKKIFLFIIIISAFILCIMYSKNKKSKINRFVQRQKQPKTNCQIDYQLCQENKKRGNTHDQFCFRCKSNGDYPDKIYHPKTGWIHLDPKSGQTINKS